MTLHFLGAAFLGFGSEGSLLRPRALRLFSSIIASRRATGSVFSSGSIAIIGRGPKPEPLEADY